MSLRDTILHANDRKPVAVEVPEWDCTVYLRVMSAKEQTGLVAKYRSQDQDASADGMLAELVATSLVDENGNRLFTTDADLEILASKSTLVIQRLSGEVLRINGMADDAVDDAGKD